MCWRRNIRSVKYSSSDERHGIMSWNKSLLTIPYYCIEREGSDAACQVIRNDFSILYFWAYYTSEFSDWLAKLEELGI